MNHLNYKFLKVQCLKIKFNLCFYLIFTISFKPFKIFKFNSLCEILILETQSYGAIKAKKPISECDKETSLGELLFHEIPQNIFRIQDFGIILWLKKYLK